MNIYLYFRKRHIVTNINNITNL